jgi:hypothetical protein
MKKTYVVIAGAIVVLLVASVIGLPTTAHQTAASDLQMVIEGAEAQAMAAFRLDKTCERGNTRCR